MKLSIIKPVSTDFYKTIWVEIPTNNGKFIVEHEHMPMIVILNDKEKMQLKLIDESIIDLPRYGGIVKIDRNEISVVITKEYDE